MPRPLFSLVLSNTGVTASIFLILFKFAANSITFSSEQKCAYWQRVIRDERFLLVFDEVVNVERKVQSIREKSMVKKTTFARSTGALMTLGVGLALVGTPAVAADYDYTAIPQDQMRAVATDSVEQGGEGANGPIELILDGDSSTYWHTKWSDTVDPLPHWFVVDLGNKVDNLARIDLQPRQSSNGSGRVNEYTIWAVDAETCDENQFGEAEPVATGSVPFAERLNTVSVTFAPVAAKCVKVQYDSSWGGIEKPETVGSLAEFNAFTGTEVEAPEPGTGPEITVPEGAFTISDGTLNVVLHPDFPQVVKYELGDKVLPGKLGDPLTKVSINGQATAVTVGQPVVAADSVTYPVTAGAVSFNVVVSVAESVLTYKLTDISDPDGSLRYIEIPNLDLVSLRETDEGAGIYAANVSVNRNNSGDMFTKIADAPVGAVAQAREAWMIAAGTDQLAAGFDSNAVVDTKAKRPGSAHTGFKYTLSRVSGAKVGAVSPGE